MACGSSEPGDQEPEHGLAGEEQTFAGGKKLVPPMAKQLQVLIGEEQTTAGEEEPDQGPAGGEQTTAGEEEPDQGLLEGSRPLLARRNLIRAYWSGADHCCSCRGGDGT